MNHNAKYAFYYLLSLVALVFMGISTGMIAFSIIDKMLPDALNFTNANFDGPLRFAISALLISTPIFYFISNLIASGLKKQEIAKDSGVRRWLTYFTLLVSSLIMLGVFISVINNFLAGDLTSQFILKAVAVFVIAAAVFSFYFYDIKRDDLVKKDKVVKIFFWASLALVTAAFVASWFFVESPKTARNRRLDQLVINNISSLESVINNYYSVSQKLPDSLEVLVNDKSLYLDQNILVDPETRVPIVYQKSGETEFQLCATFRTDSLAGTTGVGARPVSYPSYAGDKNHAAGYQCLKGNLWSLVKAETVK